MSQRAGLPAFLFALLLGALLALGPGLALAQASAQHTNTSAGQSSQPIAGQNSSADQPNAAVGAAPGPQTPAPARTSIGAGSWWWWVAGIIIIVLLIWGVPRVVRSLKDSAPHPKRGPRQN